MPTDDELRQEIAKTFISVTEDYINKAISEEYIKTKSTEWIEGFAHGCREITVAVGIFYSRRLTEK